MAVRPGQLAFMPSGGIDMTLRGRDAFVVGPDGSLIPKQPEAGMRRITPASGVAASTAPTLGFGDVIARDAARRLQFANRYRAQQQQQQQAAPAPSTFGQRVGAALRQPLTSPTGMGLATAALTGLEMSGPQPVPTSTGQILARAGMAGLQAYASGKEGEAARAMASRKLEIEEQRLDIDRVRAMASAAPNKTTLEKNLRAAGYNPGTPEYEEAVRAFLQKPSGTSITLDQKGEEEYQKQAVQYAFKRLGEADEAVRNLRSMEGELQTIVNITSVDGKAETGPLQETILGIKQIAASLSLLSDQEMADLSDDELLQRSMYKIIPMMRVSGSGSSSDKDMSNFRMAAPNFGRGALGNRKVAQGMLQIIEQEKKARRLMDTYIKDNKGSLVGFDEYADEQLGDIFKKYDVYTNEEAAAEQYEKDYKEGRIEIGDLYFNGKDYVFVTPESVEGY